MSDGGLSGKIKRVNALVPIAKVLPMVGVHVDHTQQVNCPFHDDDNASARVYVHDKDNYSANGLYCWVCGNFTTFDIVKKHTGGVREALDYFEGLGLDFGSENVEIGGSSLHHKILAKEVLAFRESMYKVVWTAKDLKLLQKYLHVYGDNSKRVRRSLYKVLLQRKLKGV